MTQFAKVSLFLTLRSQQLLGPISLDVLDIERNKSSWLDAILPSINEIVLRGLGPGERISLANEFEGLVFHPSKFQVEKGVSGAQVGSG